MTNPFDTVAVAISSGLSRRHVLKAVTSAAFAAVSGTGLRASQTAAERAIADTHGVKRRAVELRIFGDKIKSYARLLLLDRSPGRVNMPGQAPAAVVPTVLDELGGLQLSIFNASDMTLARRLPLTLNADPLPSDVSFLPGVSFAASRIMDVEPGTDYETPTDCCTTCCWGGTICACGACRDTDDDGCGNCCDSGCCPGCGGDTC